MTRPDLSLSPSPQRLLTERAAAGVQIDRATVERLAEVVAALEAGGSLMMAAMLRRVAQGDVAAQA